MATREEAFEAINSERDYQDQLPPTRTDGVERTVGDLVTMMNHYTQRLNEAWTMAPGDDKALGVMRKLAGIAVNCMEQHGAPRREGF